MSERPELVASRPPVPTSSHPNLGAPERLVSLVAGSLLVANGLRQGGIKGWSQILLGSCAVWGAYSGTSRLKRALTHSPFEQTFEREHHWDASKVISRSVTVSKPRAQVFAFCRDPANLGALMPWVDGIEQTSENTYRWTAHGPMDKTLHCDLQQREPEEGRMLHWIAGPEQNFQHDIEMHFSDAPADRGTQIKVIVACKTPLGAAGYGLAAAISKFSDKALLNVLRSIKQQLETGEVSTNKMRDQQIQDFLFVHPAASATHAAPSSTPTERSNVTPLNGGTV